MGIVSQKCSRLEELEKYVWNIEVFKQRVQQDRVYLKGVDKKGMVRNQVEGSSNCIVVFQKLELNFVGSLRQQK